MSSHRTLATLTATGALALTLTGCGSLTAGSGTTEERAVDGVTAVVLATSGTLTVEHGTEQSLTVTAGAYVLPHLTSDVRDGVLVLDTDDSPRWGPQGSVEYRLVVPDLESVRVDGSGSVAAGPDLAAGDELEVVLDGSGDVRFDDVDVETLDLSIAGSGDVEIAGSADRQRVSIEGSGRYTADELTSREAQIGLEGSGDATLTVTRTLDAHVQGSGSVTHAGGAHVTSDVDGSGRVSAQP
jgi:hypothetical protein